MFKKIVVALDGSPSSTKALEAALSMSKSEDSQLSFIHVVKEVHPQFAAGEIVLSVTELNSALRQDGERILQEAEDEAKKSHVDFSTKLVSGDPAEKILHFAKEEQTELIILGSRGLGTIKEWMLGSVSHKVTQLAECPVLVIK